MIGALTLQRVPANIVLTICHKHNRLQNQRSIRASKRRFMATRSSENAEKGVEKEDRKDDSKESPPPPPPPEKPLPGDCCGSGCIRCVWDVYYEELDDYNKLYKNDSNSNS